MYQVCTELVTVARNELSASQKKSLGLKRTLWLFIDVRLLLYYLSDSLMEGPPHCMQCIPNLATFYVLLCSFLFNILESWNWEFQSQITTSGLLNHFKSSLQVDCQVELKNARVSDRTITIASSVIHGFLFEKSLTKPYQNLKFKFQSSKKLQKVE